MAEEIFNPKWLQRGKRIEMRKVFFNPNRPQKAKWIEMSDQAGAVACLSLNNGSLPPPGSAPARLQCSFFEQKLSWY